MGVADLPQSRPMDLDKYDNIADYSKWQPNSTVRLCNVPWDSSYRDIVRFSDKAAQDKYFDSLDSESITWTRQTMVRFGKPIKLAMSFDAACKYNYITISYGREGNNRTWYYFIQDVQYSANGVTQIYVMLDVIQSFQFDVKLGRCYITRGHIGIANENQNTPEDIRRNLAIPEGLDVGAQYVIDNVEVSQIMNQTQVSVLITSTTELDSPWPKEDNKNSLATAIGSEWESYPSGTSVYLIPDANKLPDFMKIISNYPLVSTGIINIMYIPKYTPSNPSWITSNNIPSGMICRATGETQQAGNNAPKQLTIVGFLNEFRLDARYSMLKKFKTYPYSVIEATVYNGQALQIRPETVNSNDLVFQKYTFFNLPSPRMVLFPANVNRHNTSGTLDSAIAQEFLDMGIVVDNFPTTNVVNNSTIAYMTSNRNSIAWQYQNADWSQAKTQLGIQQSSAVTAQNNQFRNQNTTLQNQQAQESTDLSNFQTGVGGVINAAGSALHGDVGGTASTLLNTSVNMAFNQAHTNQNNGFRSQNTAQQNAQSTQATDLNNSYATQAMKGDYANAIAGINAKIQDAQTLQPSVSGQIGGDAFNYKFGFISLFVKFKKLSLEAERNIGEFWLRYGYMVQRFITPPSDWQCMTKATYWQMSETYLTSATCPQPYRMAIRGIFEKGVTVWRDPNDIGNLDFADNKPVDGIAY